MKMTNEMARIHAHLCADGYISTTIQRRTAHDILRYNRKNKTRRVWILGYTNTSPVLIEQFRNDIRRIHNPNIKMTMNEKKKEIKLNSKEMFERFQKLGVGDSRNWRLPKSILASSSLLKQWLRAYFDDEAHVS